MNVNDAVYRRDEGLVMGLRRLYESFGYKKFKMKKFEKYDLYLQNKSFLRNANIITVTDPAGHLLALKPDITLSIVKNIKAASLPVKVYYNENIYVADSSAGEIKEMTQMGLEYIGDLDIRALGEIILLAAESLERADDNYRIAISHMGIISDVMSLANLSETAEAEIYQLIAQKNLHGVKDVCKSLGICETVIDKICGLVTVSGEFSKTINRLVQYLPNAENNANFKELLQLSDIIEKEGLADKFILDFSVMNDVNYYNGLLFQGFINGVPKSVLSGGRYDNLVKRFGCNASAAGFAASIDILTESQYRELDYDYDVFLLYSKECDPADVLSAQRDLSDNGKRCIALSEEYEWLKYRNKIVMAPDGSMSNE